MTDYQEQLILKLLNGTISPEEHRTLNAWMNESEENKKIVNDFTWMWKASKDKREEVRFDTNEEWTKFESSISRNPVEKEIKFYSYSNALKIAASISVIALVSWLLYQIVFTHETILKESGGTMVQMNLPDGSSVWLNHYSQIVYQDDFNSDTRTLTLTGEAFFEVKPDREKPFIIETSNARIKVLGTSFNVRAYEETNNTEVFVATGLVNFSNVKNKEGITLKPGEAAVTKNSNTVLMVDAAENANVLAWKEKRLTFKSSSLRTVVKNLETYFKIDIEIRNEDISRCRFTGSFNHPTLEEIIEALSVSLDLTIDKENNVYIVDGDGC